MSIQARLIVLQEEMDCVLKHAEEEAWVAEEAKKCEEEKARKVEEAIIAEEVRRAKKE